jgi:hypothetical protein
LKALRVLDRVIDRYPYEELIDREFALDDLSTALQSSADRTTTRATLNPRS